MNMAMMGVGTEKKGFMAGTWAALLEGTHLVKFFTVCVDVIYSRTIYYLKTFH